MTAETMVEAPAASDAPEHSGAHDATAGGEHAPAAAAQPRQPAHDWLEAMPATLGERSDTAREFLDHMHGKGATREAAYEALGYYQQVQATNYKALEELADKSTKAAKEWMRERWGHEADGTVELIKTNVLAKLPPDLVDALRAARLDDGTPVFNHRAMLELLAGVARRPLAPSGKENTMSAAEEKKEIERIMREDRGRYNRDEALQARYRDLLDGESKTEGAKGTSKEIASRIAEIEKIMREDRARYNKDEALQRELLQLYDARAAA